MIKKLSVNGKEYSIDKFIEETGILRETLEAIAESGIDFTSMEGDKVDFQIVKNYN